MVRTSYAPQRTQTPPPNKTYHWLIGLGTVTIAALVLPTVVRSLIDQHHYNQGLQAYNAADCTTAIAQFDQVLQANPDSKDDLVMMAAVKKAECQAFQDGVTQQQAGKRTPALLAYLQLAQQYPQTALMPMIRQRTAQLFQQANLTALATPQICERAIVFTRANLLPQPATNLPMLYHACGKAYADRKQFPQAIAMYEAFLDEYPQHPQVEAIKRTYTQALVDDTRAKGAGTIERPGFRRIRSDGTTMVVIRNDSPEKMRLVFSGPTPRLEELKPCVDCQKYIGTGPETCPNKGPVGTYVLKPGAYDVVVKSISDRGVRPFTGTWGLDRSGEYSTCFFVVQAKKDAPTQ